MDYSKYTDIQIISAVADATERAEVEAIDAGLDPEYPVVSKCFHRELRRRGLLETVRDHFGDDQAFKYRRGVPPNMMVARVDTPDRYDREDALANGAVCYSNRWYGPRVAIIDDDVYPEFKPFAGLTLEQRLHAPEKVTENDDNPAVPRTEEQRKQRAADIRAELKRREQARRPQFGYGPEWDDLPDGGHR